MSGEKLRDRRRLGVFWLEDGMIDTGVAATIGPAAFLIYAILVRHANHNAVSFPSRATIAREAGLSEESVKLALRVLVARKLIDRKTKIGAHGSFSVTEILPLPTAEKAEGGVTGYPPGGQPATPPRVARYPTRGSPVTRPGGSPLPHKEHTPKEEQKKDNKAAPAAVVSILTDFGVSRNRAQAIARVILAETDEARALRALDRLKQIALTKSKTNAPAYLAAALERGAWRPLVQVEAKDVAQAVADAARLPHKPPTAAERNDRLRLLAAQAEQIKREAARRKAS